MNMALDRGYQEADHGPPWCLLGRSMCTRETRHVLQGEQKLIMAPLQKPHGTRPLEDEL